MESILYQPSSIIFGRGMGVDPQSGAAATAVRGKVIRVGTGARTSHSRMSHSLVRIWAMKMDQLYGCTIYRDRIAIVL